MSYNPEDKKGSATRSRCPLRVLLIEDCEPDAILLIHALRTGGFEPTWKRVDTREGMATALEGETWDLILADHAMPAFSAPEALELLEAHHLDVPFIIVSGQIEEKTAVAAMNAGAHDYIMKERLARLVPAVQREIREAGVRQARRKTEEALRRAHEELEIRVEQRTADLKSANQKLEKVLQDRRRLEAELLEIAENERRRIGFDLHDDLGQKLTGISLMIKGIEQKLTREEHPASGDVKQVQLLVNDLIHHTHNLAHQFASLDPAGADIATVIQGLATNVRRMFQVKCYCTVCEGLPRLPGFTVTQFYKIAQEAVSNAIKHGKASLISISLENDKENLVLRVLNDGQKFVPPVDAKNRMGLRIMNYRANTIGAVMDITPGDTGGTVVTCQLPVNQETKQRHKPTQKANEQYFASGRRNRQPEPAVSGDCQ